MFELDEKSQDLCTIITIFGSYKYLRLPMGLKCLPDIAQAAMENVLSDIEDANVYIDDVGAFSSDWDHHVNFLATILHLQANIGATPQRHFLGGEGGAWYEKGVTLRGLRISKKKEILC